MNDNPVSDETEEQAQRSAAADSLDALLADISKYTASDDSSFFDDPEYGEDAETTEDGAAGSGAGIYASTENPGDDDTASVTDNSVRLRMELYDWLQCIVFAVICGIFIFMFIGRTIGVEGDSMLQTLHWNDRIIMSNLFYTPKYGDIVVFRSPSDVFGGTPLVKRVIAVEGQTINIDFDKGEVSVDGEVIYERYINEPTLKKLNFQGPYVVPEGHVFVMGDNRNYSSDSRDSRVGPVDTRYILGKVLFVVIPGRDHQTPRDWSRIGPVKTEKLTSVLSQ